MARGINKTIIVGTLGHDPSLRYTPSGTAVAELSVATNESWMDKQTGQRQERTEWHRIVIWGKLGEIAKQYLVKGSMAYFEGRLQTEKWTDKNNIERYTTKIIATEMQMLGGTRANQAHDNTDHRPQPADTSASDYAKATGGSVAGPSPADDGFDDSIPF